MQPTYFDHAATSPMRAVAIEAYVKHADKLNPGAAYAAGRRARSVLDDAREQIAALLGADPIEVIFTASGTEADNLAIQGLFSAASSSRVVTSPLEHPAVAETVRALEAEVDYLGVDRSGHVVDFSALDTPAAVVTCMMANNETGAIQPIEEIAARAAATKSPMHVDAVQAVGKLEIDFHALGITTLAASAHKFGGPRGTGFLLARRSPAPSAILHGGGQERGIRPGTVDVAAAAATAAALQEAYDEREAEHTRVQRLRDRLESEICRQVDDVVINSREPVLPSHLHVSFPGADGDSLIMLLDSLGISASTGSACHSGVSRRSETLEAMGLTLDEGIGSLRLSLGPTTTEEDVSAFSAEIADVVQRARLAGQR
ncbi:cysteine desulfurase [Corynebacterium yudongzhengii]|uniref:Cysteine desulfurase n=1 Tax=Corynebacterium yudongzhengii TaxID=2080740 RepID=A0A2U1T9C3_9CORY|nr:cysteine desulfurase family protein [Corynebacterium yudongzhengii]AWB82085.1 cysteine desulfurase [Corynebacterium yudongzhengii]PWC02589.1 cysteine desulfurase [Corynebacterium yudongzhengii]